MKFLSIFLTLAIFVSCNEENKSKKSSTVDNNLTAPPDEVQPIISEDEKRRLIENSFTVVVDSNQTVAGGDSKNYIKVMIVPLQEFTVEIENNSTSSDSMGEILIDPPNMLPGTYFAPGERSGGINLVVSNGEVTKKVIVSINGPLQFGNNETNNETVAEAGENNVITLGSTGGSGQVSYQFLPGQQLGRIEGNKYYPPEENEFISTMNDINRDANPQDYQYFYTIGVLAADSNNNLADGSIKIYPKMRYELTQNDQALEPDSIPNLSCSRQMEDNPLNQVNLQIVGGRPPFEIVNNDVGFLTSGSEYNFNIKPPVQCNSQSNQTLVLRDSMGNTREININLLANLEVNQNIAQRDNTNTSNIQGSGTEELNSETTKEDTQDFILTITGGLPPYDLIKDNQSVEVEELGNNQFKVTESLTDEVNNFTLKDSLNNNIDIILNQKIGSTTTVTTTPLDLNNPFLFFEVSPSSSVIQEVSYDNSVINLNTALYNFMGKYNSELEGLYRGKNFYVPLKDYTVENPDQGYVNVDIKVTDNVGTTYDISQKAYLPYYHKYRKFNEDNFEYLRDINKNDFNTRYQFFSRTADFLLGNNFLRDFKYRVSRMTTAKLPDIFLGEERYDEVKLHGGINLHDSPLVFFFRDYLNNNSRTTFLGYLNDTKSCNEPTGQNYTRGAKGLFGESWGNRGTGSFTYKNNFHGLFSRTFQDNNFSEEVNRFNSNLRAKTLPDRGANRFQEDFKATRYIRPRSMNLPSNSLFPTQQDRDLWTSIYKSYQMTQNIFIGGIFEIRKRPITLYSGAQNIQTINHGEVLFEIPQEQLVCYTFIENYKFDHANTTEDIDDSIHQKIDINTYRPSNPNAIAYNEEYNAFCTSGRDLSGRYFVDNNNNIKKFYAGNNLVWLYTPFEENPFSSDIYHLYNNVIGQKIIGSNISHNFFDGIDCSDEPTNMNLGVHIKMPDNQIISRLFNYFPDETLIRAISTNSNTLDYTLIPAFKKQVDCSRGDHVILKVPHAPGPIEEINLTEVLNNLNIDQDLDFTDIVYDGVSIFLTGLTPQVAGTSSTVDVPFIIKFSIEDTSQGFFKIFDRRYDPCASALTISAPYFDDKSRIAIMFDVAGRYLKGGSTFQSVSEDSRDIGRIEFDHNNGNLLFFRRFENFTGIENYYSQNVHSFDSPSFTSTHLIKNDASEFFEIRYYNFVNESLVRMNR